MNKRKFIGSLLATTLVAFSTAHMSLMCMYGYVGVAEALRTMDLQPDTYVIVGSQFLVFFMMLTLILITGLIKWIKSSIKYFKEEPKCLTK